MRNLTDDLIKRHPFPSAPIALHGPLSVRANSRIFRAIYDSPAPYEAAVKHCLNSQSGRPDELAALTQFTSLTRVSHAFKNGQTRFRVPTPHCIDPQLGVFSMSWVNGESLSHLLRQPNALLCGVHWMHDVGAWLGYFHKTGPLQTQRVDEGEHRLAVANIATAAHIYTRLTHVTKALAASAHALRNETVAVSWLHGDCKADNFILSGPNIYGIDISLCNENPVEYDLAMFLNNLNLLLYNPRMLPLWLIKSRLVKAFWAGYQSTGPTVSSHYLVWVRLNFLLAPWQALFNSKKSGASNWILKKMYAHMATDLSTQLRIDNARAIKP